MAEETPLPKQTEEIFILEVLNRLKIPGFVSLCCQWEEKRGWGEEGVLKVNFTSSFLFLFW